MARAHSLELSQVVGALDPAVFEHYLSRRLPTDAAPTPLWAVLHGETLDEHLRDATSPEVADGVREELGRVGDIASESGAILLQGYEHAGLRIPAQASRETLALTLLLDHQEVWDYVWTRHLWLGSARKVSAYKFEPSDGQPDKHGVSALEVSLRSWSASQGRGERGRAQAFTDRGEFWIRIQYAAHPRTLAAWEDDEIAFHNTSLAREDVLVFDEQTHVLRVQASSRAMREEYLRLFARHLLGDERAAERALASELFTLLPFQEGKFDYGASGVITRVAFVSAELQVFGVAGTSIIIKSRDVLESLKYDLEPLSLQRGILKWVRLRYFIHQPGERRTSVSFTITPPSHSNLRENAHVVAILHHLEQQGVKLR